MPLLLETGDGLLLESSDGLLLEDESGEAPVGTQYFTDFSEYTTGVIPSDWTARWVTSGATWSVQEVSGATGGKVLRGVRTTFGRSVCTWNDIDADAERDEIEILVRVRATTKPTNSSVGGVMVRGSGSSASETGYVGNPLYTSGGDAVAISEYVSGTFTENGKTAEAWTANDWYWLRFQVHGTALKAKRWSGAAADEPAWDVEVTDASISAAGWVGAFIFPAVTLEWDTFGVGTGGAAAPSEAPSGTTATPDPVSITFSIPTPTVRATVKPDPVVFTFSAAAPTVRATAKPDPVSLSFSIVAPSIRASVKPDPVAITFSVTTPTLPGQSITVTPDPVAFTFSVATPRVLATVKPSPVSMVFGVTSPSIRAAVRPDPVVMTFSVPTPTIGGAASATPDRGYVWTSSRHLKTWTVRRMRTELQTIAAIKPLLKHTSANRVFGVDLTDYCDNGDVTITDADAATQIIDDEGTEGDLTLGTPAPNTAAFPSEADGSTVAIGKGIQLSISGGTAGNDYRITVPFTDSDGETDAVVLVLKVRDAATYTQE